MEQGSISIITLSYSRDLERCKLLCESIDHFVTGYGTHYIVIDDQDLELFKPFASENRKVILASSLLPKFWPLPKWKGRRYWWAPRLRVPIYGWHMQQLYKIAMTMAQPSRRVICTDSDNFFCKPTDLREYAGLPRSPLHFSPGDVNPERPSHVLWWQNAHKLLGLEIPGLPGDDYIGNLIVWDRDTVCKMAARIEKVSKLPWWVAMARMRDFSEYMTYGVFVVNDGERLAHHEPTRDGLCAGYWSGPALDREGLKNLFSSLKPHHRAVGIQSHTGTSIALIREVGFETS